MSLLLVRHAAAMSRRAWEGDDDHRPLSDEGRHQAERLVQHLAPYPIGRVLSSPAVRCIDTVAPLARALGLQVEAADALAEGSSEDALDLLRGVEGTAVLCTHGDVIPRVLEALVVHDGLDLGDRPSWSKGSTWALDSDGIRFTTATYLEPPG